MGVTGQWSNVADGARRRVVGTRWAQRRVVAELALGMLLVVGGAVGVLAWHRQAVQSQTVLVTARDLTRGMVLTAADVTGATVTGARGLTVLAPHQAGAVLGATLVADLPAATPLTPGMVEHRQRPGVHEALVSVALRPGEAPVDLAAGDVVRLVSVRLDPLGAAPPAVTYDTAEVWSVRPPTDLDNTTLVTVRAATEVLERLALADRVRVGVITP